MNTTNCRFCGIEMVLESFEDSFEGFQWTEYRWRAIERGVPCTRFGHYSIAKEPSRKCVFEGPTAIYSVPRKFFEDHEERELPIGEVVSKNSRIVKVRMDRAYYLELLSDADYQADPGEAVDPEQRPYQRSAQTAMKRLLEQGEPS